MKHKLTTAQAKKLNRNDLAGKTVDVALVTADEHRRARLNPKTRMAKSVRYKGKEIGQYLELDR